MSYPSYMEGIVALASIGVIATPIVSGVVVIYLAYLGIKHPEHKDYFIQLMKSKKPGAPEVTLGSRGNIRRRNDNDEID